MSLILEIINVFKNARVKGIYNKSKSRIGVENRSLAVTICKVIEKADAIAWRDVLCKGFKTSIGAID
jgi:hypothetical protein